MKTSAESPFAHERLPALNRKVLISSASSIRCCLKFDLIISRRDVFVNSYFKKRHCHEKLHKILPRNCKTCTMQSYEENQSALFEVEAAFVAFEVVLVFEEDFLPFLKVATMFVFFSTLNSYSSESLTSSVRSTPLTVKCARL